MTAQALIIRSLLHMDCQEVAFDSFYVMQDRQAGFSQIEVQQYYDELGRGQDLRYVIADAYGQRLEYDRLGKKIAARDFQIKYQKVCEGM